LVRHLVRLVTPPGGIVLDPFAGTGTTGEAATLEGCDYILIEIDPESIKDCHVRLDHLDGCMARRRWDHLKTWRRNLIARSNRRSGSTFASLLIAGIYQELHLRVDGGVVSNPPFNGCQ
jgi:hypothetical protein